MRVALVTAIVLAMGLFAQPVGAADLQRRVMDAAFSHMASAYLCREAVGGLSYYQAAETIATGALQLVGFTSDEAVLMVDKMARKFEADTRVLPNDKNTTQACVERLNEGLRQIDVVEAEARAAR